MEEYQPRPAPKKQTAVMLLAHRPSSQRLIDPQSQPYVAQSLVLAALGRAKDRKSEP